MNAPGAVAAAALDSLPTQTAILDEDGTIVYTNRAWREFGETNDFVGNPESIGVNYLSVCDTGTGESPDSGNDAGDGDDGDGATAAEGIRAVLDGRRDTFEFEYPCHGPDGEQWFTMRANPFRHDGERYVLVVHLDITDRKLAERETEERADRLRNVAQLLSHDLRNPLAVAAGFTDLLAEDLGDDDRLDRVETALDRMERILTDALVLARYETVPEVERRPVDLAEAAREAWGTVETDDASLAVDGTVSFYAEPELLRHVLENLFGNAVDHGGPDAAVTVGALDDGAGFFVADDGPGIPADERDAVFDSGYTTANEGTGLGLAIVTRIVDAHDWEVRATESESGGARFEVTGVDLAEATAVP